MDAVEIRQRLIAAKTAYGSLRKLAPIVGITYRNLSRYLTAQRTPNPKQQIILGNFLKTFPPAKLAYRRRFKQKFAEPVLSQDLAELVGLMFGDGEVKSSGEMRLSFDCTKDRFYINDRAFYLIFQLINPNKISFESEKRIWFQNASFVNWLASTGFPTGSRPLNDATIPEWCFSKEEYLAAFIRGLFDTDGTFSFHDYRVEICFGRFSAKYTKFPYQLRDGLQRLGISARVNISKDGRFKIRVTGKMNILLFFCNHWFIQFKAYCALLTMAYQ